MDSRTEQLKAVASQLNAMADTADVKRLDVPEDSFEHRMLMNYSHRLRNYADDLCSTGVALALDKLAPHYDDMLSVVRGLKDEMRKESHIAHTFTMIDSALSIARSAISADLPGLVSGIVSAKTLIRK